MSGAHGARRSRAPPAVELAIARLNEAFAAQACAVNKEMGWDTAYSENVQPADMAESLRDYAKRGYTLIIGHTGRSVVSPLRAARCND